MEWNGRMRGMEECELNPNLKSLIARFSGIMAHHF